MSDLTLDNHVNRIVKDCHRRGFGVLEEESTFEDGIRAALSSSLEAIAARAYVDEDKPS